MASTGIVQWIERVSKALSQGQSLAPEDLSHPGAQAVIAMTQGVLLPQVDNFTPPERTPWGGYEIVKEFKAPRGVTTSEIVGESWELSGHSSFPNRFSMHHQQVPVHISIQLLEAVAPEALYGLHNVQRHQGKMPFMVKLLNSGSWHPYRQELLRLGYGHLVDLDNHALHMALSSIQDPSVQDLHRKMLSNNLSVQVHPKRGDIPGLPSKTEAWVILSAEKGAGIYLGIKEGIAKDTFEIAMRSGQDISVYLNFVPVFPGDVYFIPSGTLHAIGAGILLAEPQETSETTFRAYDWGRLYKGAPRQLHYFEVMKVSTWDGLHGESLVSHLRRTPQQRMDATSICVETLVDIPEFQHYRLTLPHAGAEFLGDTSRTGIQGFTMIDGSVDVIRSSDGSSQGPYHKGQSFLVPAAMGSFALRSVTAPAIVLQTMAGKLLEH